MNKRVTPAKETTIIPIAFNANAAFKELFKTIAFMVRLKGFPICTPAKIPMAMEELFDSMFNALRIRTGSLVGDAYAQAADYNRDTLAWLHPTSSWTWQRTGKVLQINCKNADKLSLEVKIFIDQLFTHLLSNISSPTVAFTAKQICVDFNISSLGIDQEVLHRHMPEHTNDPSSRAASIHFLAESMFNTKETGYLLLPNGRKVAGKDKPMRSYMGITICPSLYSTKRGEDYRADLLQKYRNDFEQRIRGMFGAQMATATLTPVSGTQLKYRVSLYTPQAEVEAAEAKKAATQAKSSEPPKTIFDQFIMEDELGACKICSSKTKKPLGDGVVVRMLMQSLYKQTGKSAYGLEARSTKRGDGNINVTGFYNYNWKPRYRNVRGLMLIALMRLFGERLVGIEWVRANYLRVILKPIGVPRTEHESMPLITQAQVDAVTAFDVIQTPVTKGGKVTLHEIVVLSLTKKNATSYALTGINLADVKKKDIKPFTASIDRFKTIGAASLPAVIKVN